jgi:hypothetical protein
MPGPELDQFVFLRLEVVPHDHQPRTPIAVWAHPVQETHRVVRIDVLDAGDVPQIEQGVTGDRLDQDHIQVRGHHFVVRLSGLEINKSLIRT